MYQLLDVLIGSFLFVVRVFLILKSIFVVLQYGLYIIDVHSIWVFIVVVGLKPVWICVVFFFGQNSIEVFSFLSSQIDSFHVDNLFSLFCCFNPCLEIIVGSSANGLYCDIRVQTLSE